MNGYEKIITIMRQQKGETNNIKIGTMDSENSCVIGKLKLSSDDLLVSEHLKTGYCYKNKDNQEVIVDPLKKGDAVALYRVDEDTYLVIERLVEL